MNTCRVHLQIRGLVQGVAFRARAREQALQLGLTGQVWNLRDGGVEAVAEGDPEAVEAFVAWCRRGPADARVESVGVTPGPALGDFTSFQVVR